MIATEDERAIIATLLRYATGIDQRDWALFRTCFTEDVVADYPGFGHWVGAQAITDFMDQAHAGLGATLHRMTNFVIDGDAASAAASSYVNVVLMPPEAGGQIHQAAGCYTDRLARTGRGWQIATRSYRQVLFRSFSA